MANIQRNFIKGRMNKSLDERLIPNGEYVDALNVRLGSTEDSEIGSVENTKGNERLSELTFIDGTALSEDARCIGAIGDGARETIYWFVHDPNFPISPALPTGKLDMIVSINVESSLLIYHVVSVNDGGNVNTSLNFNPTYLITGVDMVDDLLFFTDDYNAPRKINIKRNYTNPAIGGGVEYIDGGGTTALADLLKESLLVIKRPPIAAPAITTFNSGAQENFMEERFICFAYRYRYEDNEYSATSQFTAPAFVPGRFSYNTTSKLNDGMENTINNASVTVNSGGPLVVGFDILFKEDTDSTIKVIEKFDKQELGIADDTDYSIVFDNGKIYTILPDYEILRLYDNVPRFAQAQTIMGNRLMYGNYVDGYDLTDANGNPTRFEYSAELISEDINIVNVPVSLSTGTYDIDPGALGYNVPNSIMTIDLSGISLDQGGLLGIDFEFENQSFTGVATPPVETQPTQLSFAYSLPRDYTSVYDLASDVNFIEAVGAAYNIKPVATSCDGTTWTDIFNCIIPGSLGAFAENESGINAGGEPISIISSPSSNEIGFQLVSMRFTDPSGPTDSYEYYKINTAIDANYASQGAPSSLHSNRSYELGIVYMDEFNRSTITLVSPNNSVHVPCELSPNKNYIRATIPATQKPPSWATRYKFVLKADREDYETIYSQFYYLDTLTNETYILLEGENARKVEEGDRFIVKADALGPLSSCAYTTVLEKESKPSGFLPAPAPTLPSGVYMKILARDFSTTTTIGGVNTSIFEPPVIDGSRQDGFCQQNVLGSIYGYDASGDVDIPAGSVIEFSISNTRNGVGNSCTVRKMSYSGTFPVNANYSNLQDWWDSNNIITAINSNYSATSSTQNVEVIQCPSTTVTSFTDPTCAPAASGCGAAYGTVDKAYLQWQRNSGGLLRLMVLSSLSCTGVNQPNNRKVSLKVRLKVTKAQPAMIFETIPQDTQPDVFYEADGSYAIDSSGFHSGNVQDQTATLPAIIDTTFFNCFTFGNGAESYKIRDSITGKDFDLGNRTLSTSAQDYKEADRFADMTYSGVYNDESNVNKLNEFNLGLLNFKPLEDSFGPIQKMDGRETDVLVLQEDKISYVLAGKNLLSDSAAGGTIASVPEVLGTQIARTEEYGISYNPESYVSWGYDKYFTDAKRGAVIQLRGSGQGEQLTVISEAGMRSWFRDLFNESFATQKLGAFDPYMNEYVLSSNDIALPIEVPCDNCGITRSISMNPQETEEYCVYVGFLVGDVTIDYNVPADSVFSITATFNGVSQTQAFINGPASGSLVVNKNVVGVTEISILVESFIFIGGGTRTIDVTTSCVDAEEITIVEVCVTSDSDAGKFIHNEYRWTDGVFVSPIHSEQVTFASGTTNPLVSRYNSITGLQGGGVIPADSATVSIISNKFGIDNYDVDPTSAVFSYLRTNTLYNNTPSQIKTLLDTATSITPTGSTPTFQGDFTMPAAGQYLYLIWDYRERVSKQLCYSNPLAGGSTQDACCNCIACSETCTYYNVSNTSPITLSYLYADCASGAIVTANLSGLSAVNVCSRIEPYPVTKTSNLVVTWLQCGCP